MSCFGTVENGVFESPQRHQVSDYSEYNQMFAFLIFLPCQHHLRNAENKKRLTQKKKLPD